MSESILDEWERKTQIILDEAKKHLDEPSAVLVAGLCEHTIMKLIARDRILREALQYICTYAWMAKSSDQEKWINEFVDVAEKALCEADKILETTNKGENK